MPTKENFRELFKTKEKTVTFHYPTGVDLNKLKAMTITPVIDYATKQSDGVRSNFVIISVAGETMALGSTGLLPSEKPFHDKSDFERLYIHPDLKGDQATLEELYKRMFQLNKNPLKRILPPKDSQDYTLLMKSLRYRLELLQREINGLGDTDTADTREVLEHFYRLRELIDSLEGSWKKKKTQGYVAVVSESGRSPTQEEKLSMDEMEAARLLQQFGLVLLQAQHQLPGFTFPFSTNEVVAKLRGLDINADDFEDTVKEEGHTIQPSIEDVLHPAERKELAEKRFVEAGQTLLEAMIENLPDEDTKELFTNLLDRENPPASVTKFVKDLLDITEEISESRFMLLERIKPLRQQLEAVQEELDTLEDKFQEAQQKMQTMKDQRDADVDANANSREKLLEEIEDLEAERDDCLEEKQALEHEIERLQNEEAQKKNLEDATTKLRAEVETYKKSAQEKAQLTQQLEAKDKELEALQQKQKSIEQLETTVKDQRLEISRLQKEWKNLQTLQKKLSKERFDLEAQLGSYKGLEKLVSNIPLNATTAKMTNFDAFSSRLRKLLDERKQRALPANVAENEEGKTMEGGGVEGPSRVNVDVPTVLEMKAQLVKNLCQVLEALEKVHLSFFEGLESSLLEQLRMAIPSLGEHPAEVADALQRALVYSVGPYDKFIKQPYESIYEKLPTVVKSSEEFNHAFLERDVDDEQVRSADDKLETIGLPPSYASLFYLYLEALAQWVNCIENISKPLECPQIPPILKRDLAKPCKLPTSP